MKAALICLLVVATLTAFGHFTETYGLQPHRACAFALARHRQPPADLLFLGNSRFGAAVDAAYVQNLIESELEREVIAERISLTGNSYPTMRILSEEYIAERGVPQKVVVQLIHTMGEDHNTVAMPVLERGMVSYASPEQIIRIQSGAELNPTNSLLPAWMKAGHETLLAALTRHVVAGIYAAIRYPSDRFTKGKIGCVGGSSRMYRQSVFWLWDDIGRDRQRRILSHTGSFDALDARPDTVYPLMLRAPGRKFENAQMNALIETWTQTGAEVFLVSMPSIYETPVDKQDLYAMAELFPDAQFLPVDMPFKSQPLDYAAQFYRDGDHLNLDGARIVSQSLAEYFAAYLDD